MKSVKVPIEYNYVPVFLTLICNLNCSYCINNNNGVLRAREEMTAEQWISGLNRLEMNNDLPITLEGGEPTLHPGFYKIIKEVNHPIDILTNLQFDIDEFIRNVDPRWLNEGKIPGYKSIRASFHSEKMSLEETIQKAAKLQDAGFKIGLFSLNIPESIEANMQMAELARENKIYFFIKDFLGNYNRQLFGYYKYPKALDGINKKAMCRTKELLLAPDGKIYRCHRDLYHAENSIGHLLDENFEVKGVFRPCENYGTCNPCDVKLKTNRFLQMGSCSVEIKEV